MNPRDRHDLPRTIALGIFLLSGLVVFWIARAPRGTDTASSPEVRQSAPAGESVALSPDDSTLPAVTTLATQTPAAAAPVPPLLDLRRLPLAARKGDEAPALVLPTAASLDSIEALFAHEVGALVTVDFGDQLRFTGELLRKETQPGTSVLGLTVANEISTLHLERTRRGDYRGSLVHRHSPTAHRIATNGDGALVIEQRSFHELVCAAPGATPQSASGLPLPAGVTPDTPEEAEVAEATPPSRDSRPHATAVIYLDFDGQTVTGTEWNSLRNITTINAAASALTTNEMDEVWARVAEDFSPFHVSVTTNLARYNGAPQNRRIRVIVTPTSSWYGSAGGVAYLGSFTWTGDTPCWVFENLLGDEVKSIAEAASHEAGHTFNLKHDGRGTNEYYYGVDNTLLSWGPIMGAGYNADFTQWSKGEYSSATNLEDDLAILSNATNGFGYRADDKGDTLLTAPTLALQAGSSTLVADVGIIEKNTDLDLMRFTAGTGTVNLQVRPAAVSPNLYLKAELLDSAGTVLLSRTATKSATTLTLSQSVAAGTYYLRVDGVTMPVAAGSSPPYAYDVSGYGSLGEYAVSGSIPVSAAPAILSVSPTVITQSTPAGQNAGSQAFTVRNAGGGSLTYSIAESLPWLSVSPSGGTSSGTEIEHTLTYTTTGLAAGSYPGTITVSAAGITGSPQSITVTLTVTPAGSGLTFTNGTTVTFPGSGSSPQATPYPSDIAVSGVTQSIASVSVELRNVQHTWARDLDLLLVAPNGQNVMLLSDAGGDQALAAGATLVFRDEAGSAPENGQISGGTYGPTNYGGSDTLPSPAPAGPHGTSLAGLLSGGVNGTWRLYAVDDFPSSDSGQILDGWALTFVASSGPDAPTGITATDGTLTDRVRVTWAGSSGATSYEIFRSVIDNPTAAQSLGTTTETSYDDLTTAVGETYFYRVKAANPDGTSAFSASDAGFRGSAVTSNDAFANRSTLTGDTGSDSASNTAATKESGEPNHAGNVGGKSLWWSWTAPQAGTFTVDTVGSSFDTLLAVYTGSNVSSLTVRGSDDDSGGNLVSRAVVQVTAGTTYGIAVDGYGAASGTVKLNHAFTPSPSLPSSPPSMSASDGTFSDRVRLEWTAGSGATSYDVRRGTSANFASAILLGNSASLGFDDTTAVPGTTYRYWVVSKNSAGSALNPAGPDTGFRTAAMSNDNFVNRALLTGVSASVTTSNTTATKEGNEPDHAGNAGGRSLWWLWTAPSAGTLTVDTLGSSFDTLLAVYTGPNLNALTSRGADDDSGGNGLSRVSIAVTGGTDYQIAVDGFAAASGSVKLQLAFQPPPTTPSLATGLSASDDTFSDRVRLTWTAGSGATSYDIYRHTSSLFASASLLANVTATTYDDLSSAHGTVYFYWVVARNSAGTSAPAGPESGSHHSFTQNDLFSNRTLLSGNSVNASGDSRGAGKEPGEPNHAGDTGGNSIWWTWTATSTGTLTIDTFGSNFDTVLGVYTGTNVAALTPVASNDDFNGATSRVSFVVTNDTSYHIAVDGYRGEGGNVQLHLAFQPDSMQANDDFADRLTLNGEFLSITANNEEATREPGEPTHGGTAVGRSLWWAWSAPRDGLLLLDTYGSAFDTTLGLYLGNTLGGLTELASNDDEDSGTFNSAIFIEVFAGEEFAIAVDGYNGAAGEIALNLAFTSDPIPPASVRARALPRGKIELTWTSGENATSYRIERRDPGSTRWRIAGSVSGGTLRFLQTRLRPRSYYAFRVRAVNALGSSPPSPVAGARTRGR
jgi:fibronectin type 3 domain-containing protein